MATCELCRENDAPNGLALCSECALQRRVDDLAESFFRYATTSSVALDLAELAAELNDDFANDRAPWFTLLQIDELLTKIRSYGSTIPPTERQASAHTPPPAPTV